MIGLEPSVNVVSTAPSTAFFIFRNMQWNSIEYPPVTPATPLIHSIDYKSTREELKEMSPLFQSLINDGCVNVSWNKSMVSSKLLIPELTQCLVPLWLQFTKKSCNGRASYIKLHIPSRNVVGSQIHALA